MFHTIKKGSLEYLTADTLAGTAHCFSTRLGGVSGGALASLNLGVHRGDRFENVVENYRILGDAVGFTPEEVVFTWQEHTDIILRVNFLTTPSSFLPTSPRAASMSARRSSSAKSSSSFPARASPCFWSPRTSTKSWSFPTA